MILAQGIERPFTSIYNRSLKFGSLSGVQSRGLRQKPRGAASGRRQSRIRIHLHADRFGANDQMLLARATSQASRQSGQ